MLGCVELDGNSTITIPFVCHAWQITKYIYCSLQIFNIVNLYVLYHLMSGKVTSCLFSILIATRHIRWHYHSELRLKAAENVVKDRMNEQSHPPHPPAKQCHSLNCRLMGNTNSKQLWVWISFIGVGLLSHRNPTCSMLTIASTPLQNIEPHISITIWSSAFKTQNPSMGQNSCMFHVAYTNTNK